MQAMMNPSTGLNLPPAGPPAIAVTSRSTTYSSPPRDLSVPVREKASGYTDRATPPKASGYTGRDEPRTPSAIRP